MSFEQAPAALQSALADALQRALRRLSASQHQDGGWGPYVEISAFWQTACAVLFLSAARRQVLLTGVVDDVLLLRQACAYLELHPDDWSADSLLAGEPEVTSPRMPASLNAAGTAGAVALPAAPRPVHSALSIYNLSLMVRVFFHGGREFLRRETGVRVYRSLEHLVHAQNEDGGWDACLWAYDVQGPARVFSEVGATAAALRALTEVDDPRLAPAVERAGYWLLNTQNPDGSWNNGACRPDLPPFTLTGDPRVTKTCDALCGLLVSPAFDPTADSPYRAAIQRGLAWLLRRTRPVLEKHLNPAAWGWGYTAEDYENLTQVLEVLLALPDASRTLIADCAGWLLQGQHRMAGDIEDGRWVLGDTARIALSLNNVLRLLP